MKIPRNHIQLLATHSPYSLGHELVHRWTAHTSARAFREHVRRRRVSVEYECPVNLRVRHHSHLALEIQDAHPQTCHYAAECRG